MGWPFPPGVLPLPFPELELELEFWLPPGDPPSPLPFELELEPPPSSELEEFTPSEELLEPSPPPGMPVDEEDETDEEPALDELAGVGRGVGAGFRSFTSASALISGFEPDDT